ncbi:hypothetical protein AB0H37_43625 [Actinomadura sp. NPDC023710]|uniref:hypothetical protein n=1 Tax=Actinomadura sp. NPDC023710 TaxID=3158219 RepID=UPI0033FC9545
MDMDHGGLPGLGMLLVHAVSVLVTSAWLQSGEARLCALARLLVGLGLRPALLLLVFLTAGPAGSAPQLVAVSSTDGHTLLQAVLRHAVARRGPPGTKIVPRAAA